MASGARVTIRTYAKWFGLDRYTAYDELTMLGVPLSSGDLQWATRPPPVPKADRDHVEPGSSDGGLPPGWIEWGGEPIFPVGFTSGGCPYGLFAWQLDDYEGAETFGADWDLLRQQWRPPGEESMETARPTITDTLQQFLSEQSARLSPRTLASYQEVVYLLTESLDGEGYMALYPDETAFWEPLWRQDSRANSFCNIFGPDKIVDHTERFLGDFLVDTVGATRGLVASAATVTKKLAAWLEEHGYSDPADTRAAIGLAGNAARVLPRAQELGESLNELSDKTKPEAGDEEFDELHVKIARLAPGKMWFAGSRGEIGPLLVPREVSDLAEVGWGISNLVLARRSGGRWRLLQAGTVYAL